MATPGVDLAVVTRQQHSGDVHAAEAGRAGVLRIFQKTVGEAFAKRTGFGTQNAGELANNRIDDHH